MLLLISLLTVFSSTGSAEEKCKGELKACLAAMPLEGNKGLPTSLEQVNKLCRSYKMGMECVDKWNRACLTTEVRLRAEKAMASAQLFMGLLCAEGDFKREYLNHTDCFGGVSRDWDRCNGYFQDAVHDTSQQGHRLSYTQRTVDVCCARFAFNRCIAHASRAKCTRDGALLLRRISETLSHDSRCDHFHSALCSAGGLMLPGIRLLLLHAIVLLLLKALN